MTRTLLLLLICSSTFLFFNSAEAKRFRNSYISFELPEGWNCRSQGVSWICHHGNKLIKKEAQIVIAAKEAGPSDTLKNYMQYLKRPRTTEGYKKGTTVKTRPIHTKQKLIGNKTWVDSLHLSGESEAYYTRYAATAHKDLAIIATFTIHKNAYPYHSAGILQALESLTIVFKKPIVANNASGYKRGGTGKGIIGGPVGTGIGTNLEIGEDLQTRNKSGSKDTLFKILGALMLIGAGIVYYLIKKSR